MVPTISFGARDFVFVDARGEVRLREPGIVEDTSPEQRIDGGSPLPKGHWVRLEFTENARVRWDADLVHATRISTPPATVGILAEPTHPPRALDATKFTKSVEEIGEDESAEDAFEQLKTVLFEQAQFSAENLSTLLALRDYAHWQLDVRQRDVERLLDAVDIAIEQVQDKRIDWLEQGPEVTVASFLVDLVLMIGISAGIGIVGALGKRLVTSLYKRIDAKKLAASAEQQLLTEGVRTAQQKMVHHNQRVQALSGRIQDMRHHLARSEARVRDLDAAYREMRSTTPKKAASWLAGTQRANRLDAARARADAADHRAHLQTLKAERDKADAALRKAFEDRPAAAMEVAKDGNLPASGGGQDLAEGAAAQILKDLAKTFLPGGSGAGTPSAGSREHAELSLSAQLKSKASHHRHARLTDFAAVRREVDFLVAAGLGDDGIVDLAAIEMMKLVGEIGYRDPLEEADYQPVLLALAKQVELSIWATTFEVASHTRATYTYQGKYTSRGYKPVVEKVLETKAERPVEKRIVDYLQRRFAPGGTRDDLFRLLDGRFAEIETGKSAIGADEVPLIGGHRSGQIRESDGATTASPPSN